MVNVPGSEFSELAAVQLATPKEFRECVELYVRRHPEGYLTGAGDNIVVIPKRYLHHLVDDLNTQNISFSMVAVKSMADLSPDEAAELRRRRGKPANPAHSNRRKVLEDLQKHYGVSSNG